MAKNKLRRFADNATMDCVFQPNLETAMADSFPLKGNWHADYFKNDNPIIVELGCGKGEYAVGLGKLYPKRNYIGIDIKGARIWEGANEVRSLGLKNVAFVRAKIDYVHAFFAKAEVDEIWLTFSDPQPSKPNKRLSSKIFIDRYRQFLKPGGIIHLKTDSDVLFESTLEEIAEHGYEMIEHSWDLYKEMPEDLDQATREILTIRTHYETIFSAKGFKIKYCKFRIG
ncbi:MAG: tRNA (guanosine(46)-N7)-methyltransferase TrmB [Crocinitomix sp.]|nr:tRNA (guanosine(46)-N7)-methyltransferase TrmB [Crocinitomix sp.]